MRKTALMALLVAVLAWAGIFIMIASLISNNKLLYTIAAVCLGGACVLALLNSRPDFRPK